MSNFNLVMISAGFEHGGNVTHRHLDGHPDLFVYPFESQLGNRDFTDFLASIERVQYRYPEFPEGKTAEELYELIIDEEMKTFLRKRNGSKFKDVNLVMNEQKRISKFSEILGDAPHPRARIIEAFFRSTFDTWENFYGKINSNTKFVGYSPAIGIDAERIIRDFPDVKIIHIIRNPFSAFFDTKRRPFPQTINKYLITWNIYHSTVEIFAKQYPNNVRIFRYEDLVSDKELFMKEISKFIKVDFHSSMLFPSWNGVELQGDIAPWGTVMRSTFDYNKQVIELLSNEERKLIGISTAAIARHFHYQDIDYLKPLYDVD